MVKSAFTTRLFICRVKMLPNQVDNCKTLKCSYSTSRCAVATKATAFASVLYPKLHVFPLFELGVVLGIMTVATSLVDTTKVLHILFIKVARRYVSNYTEPPAIAGLKHTVVEVHCSTVGQCGLP
jgi:hypothetical protein